MNSQWSKRNINRVIHKHLHRSPQKCQTTLRARKETRLIQTQTRIIMTKSLLGICSGQGDSQRLLKRWRVWNMCAFRELLLGKAASINPTAEDSQSTNLLYNQVSLTTSQLICYRQDVGASLTCRNNTTEKIQENKPKSKVKSTCAFIILMMIIWASWAKMAKSFKSWDTFKWTNLKLSRDRALGRPSSSKGHPV